MPHRGRARASVIGGSELLAGLGFGDSCTKIQNEYHKITSELSMAANDDKTAPIAACPIRSPATTGCRDVPRRSRMRGADIGRGSTPMSRRCVFTIMPGIAMRPGIAQGVPIKVVSERLGHHTIAMTMDVYAHVLPAQDHDAATAIGAALDGHDGHDGRDGRDGRDGES